jgi:sporulation protein YlmC with PRC-barrel domain
MIRARELAGRAVVDMDAAEKIGKVDGVILDPDACRVAGFIVTHDDPRSSGGRDHLTIRASSVHAIGPDAITVRHGAVAAGEAEGLEELPRVSDVVGRKVVSEHGRLLGIVSDVLIDGEDGRIIAYALTEHGGAMGKLERMFNGDKDPGDAQYLRADVGLRSGRDLIVAPDHAVGPLDGPATVDPDEADEPVDVTRVSPAPVHAADVGWSDPTPAKGRPGQWRRGASQADVQERTPADRPPAGDTKPGGVAGATETDRTRGW